MFTILKNLPTTLSDIHENIEDVCFAFQPLFQDSMYCRAGRQPNQYDYFSLMRQYTAFVTYCEGVRKNNAKIWETVFEPNLSALEHLIFDMHYNTPLSLIAAIQPLENERGMCYVKEVRKADQCTPTSCTPSHYIFELKEVPVRARVYAISPTLETFVEHYTHTVLHATFSPHVVPSCDEGENILPYILTRGTTLLISSLERCPFPVEWFVMPDPPQEDDRPRPYLYGVGGGLCIVKVDENLVGPDDVLLLTRSFGLFDGPCVVAPYIPIVLIPEQFQKAQWCSWVGTYSIKNNAVRMTKEMYFNHIWST